MDEGRSVESSKIRPIIRTVVAVLLFLFYMFPFFMIVLNSFKDKRDITKLPLSFGGKKGFTIDNYITAFQRLDFLNVFKNSFLVTGISVLLIILFSSMCAYIFVRKDWKINKLLFLLMMFSMVIPFQVVMIPLISIYGGMSAESQIYADFHASGLFCLNGGIHVSWLYQGKCSSGTGGGGAH